MNHHREDIDWNKEECILLRVGLQENEDMTAQLSIQGQQMARWLCHCADCQGPPILAVGLPLPPPYDRSPSPEFHTPPIKVCLIDNASTVSGMSTKFCSFRPISLIFLTYVLLSYFVRLHCANVHIHLPSFSLLMT